MRAESKCLWAAGADPLQGPLWKPEFVGMERPIRGWELFYIVLTEKEYRILLPVPISRVEIVIGLCLEVKSTYPNPSVTPDH